MKENLGEKIIKEDIDAYQHEKTGDEDPVVVEARKYEGIEKVSNLEKIQIINLSRLPQEVVDEALKISKEMGKCSFKDDEEGNPIYEDPVSLDISEYNSKHGISLKIKRADGFTVNTGISPSKISEWEKDGVL